MVFEIIKSHMMAFEIVKCHVMVIIRNAGMVFPARVVNGKDRTTTRSPFGTLRQRSLWYRIVVYICTDCCLHLYLEMLKMLTIYQVCPDDISATL